MVASCFFRLVLRFLDRDPLKVKVTQREGHPEVKMESLFEFDSVTYL